MICKLFDYVFGIFRVHLWSTFFGLKRFPSNNTNIIVWPVVRDDFAILGGGGKLGGEAQESSFVSLL